MNINKLKGSPKRDAYKYWHKNSKNHHGDRHRWASSIDIDLAFLDKHCKSLFCIDFKAARDGISETENTIYTFLEEKGILVYIAVIYGKWDSRWKNTCKHCGRYEYVINDDEIAYITVKRFNGEFIKVNGTHKLSVEKYWEWERHVRGYENKIKHFKIE